MRTWVINIGDDAVGEGFCHTPPANCCNPEVSTDGGQAGWSAPKTHLVIGYRLFHQGFKGERNH